MFGKKLSDKQLLDLVLKGKTSKLKGFSTHPEAIIEGVLSLSDDFQTQLS
ncbi:hypothetical protein [Chryseobacterium sp. 7]